MALLSRDKCRDGRRPDLQRRWRRLRGEEAVHVCMLGRLERVCHVDEREKVVVTAGPKMGRDTRKVTGGRK